MEKYKVIPKAHHNRDDMPMLLATPKTIINTCRLTPITINNYETWMQKINPYVATSTQVNRLLRKMVAKIIIIINLVLRRFLLWKFDSIFCGSNRPINVIQAKYRKPKHKKNQLKTLNFYHLIFRYWVYKHFILNLVLLIHFRLNLMNICMSSKQIGNWECSPQTRLVSSYLA